MNQSSRRREPGKESVWDYPRPPLVEPVDQLVRVFFGGQEVASSSRAVRVLETSHPPTIYLPPEDVRLELLIPAEAWTVCEFKGQAAYHTLQVGNLRSEQAAWSYPNPRPDYWELKDHLAFYPGRVDACYLDEEQVQAQAGDFYGGWITSNLSGPFKGGPGSRGW